jgi:hypothetical protein
VRRRLREAASTSYEGDPSGLGGELFVTNAGDATGLSAPVGVGACE